MNANELIAAIAQVEAQMESANSQDAEMACRVLGYTEEEAEEIEDAIAAKAAR